MLTTRVGVGVEHPLETNRNYPWKSVVTVRVDA